MMQLLPAGADAIVAYFEVASKAEERNKYPHEALKTVEEIMRKGRALADDERNFLPLPFTWHVPPLIVLER
jgi:hypothetical protein